MFEKEYAAGKRRLIKSRATGWCSGKDCDSSSAALCPKAMTSVQQAKISGAKRRTGFPGHWRPILEGRCGNWLKEPSSAHSPWEQVGLSAQLSESVGTHLGAEVEAGSGAPGGVAPVHDALAVGVLVVRQPAPRVVAAVRPHLSHNHRRLRRLHVLLQPRRVKPCPRTLLKKHMSALLHSERRMRCGSWLINSPSLGAVLLMVLSACL